MFEFVGLSVAEVMAALEAEGKEIFVEHVALDSYGAQVTDEVACIYWASIGCDPLYEAEASADFEDGICWEVETF